MSDVIYVLKKEGVERPYVYKKGEDQNVPYAIVDYGLHFSKDGEEVLLTETRYAPGKATKYLTVGDPIIVDDVFSAVIKEELKVDGPDAWSWEDEFTIEVIENLLTQQKVGITKSKVQRKQMVSTSIIVTDLQCKCCKR